MSKQLVVLNYNAGSIELEQIEDLSNEEIEEYLVSIGYKLSEISYMVTDILIMRNIKDAI